MEIVQFENWVRCKLIVVISLVELSLMRREKSKWSTFKLTYGKNKMELNWIELNWIELGMQQFRTKGMRMNETGMNGSSLNWTKEGKVSSVVDFIIECSKYRNTNVNKLQEANQTLKDRYLLNSNTTLVPALNPASDWICFLSMLILSLCIIIPQAKFYRLNKLFLF